MILTRMNPILKAMVKATVNPNLNAVMTGRSPAPRRTHGALVQKLALVGVMAWAGTACVSVNTYSSARTLQTGKIETRINPGFAKSSLSDIALPFVPSMDVGIRYGVNGNFDFGVTVGQAGFTFDTKFQLARNKNMAIALGPTLGGFFIGGGEAGGGFLNAAVPLIIGLNLNEKTELTFTPKLSLSTIAGAAGSASGSGGVIVPSVGVGLNLEIGPSFHLMPEASFGMATGFGEGSTGSLGPVVNFGLGIGFGGEYSH